MAFRPHKWSYEPMSITRQRERSRFERLRDDVSPLVAKGDSLSLLRARQIAQQSRDPEQRKTAVRANMLVRIRDSVREVAKQAQAANEAMGDVPAEIQRGIDREAAPRGSGPISGVPRGVAEAFPEEAVGRRVYDSTATNPTDVVTRVVGGLNTPLVRGRGMVLEEASRPTNYAGAAVRGLSFASKAPLAARAGIEVGAALAGRAATEKVTEATGNELLGTVAGLGANIATGGIAGRVRNPATAYRDMTRRIPVGASIRDVSQNRLPRIIEGQRGSYDDLYEQGLTRSVEYGRPAPRKPIAGPARVYHVAPDDFPEGESIESAQSLIDRGVSPRDKFDTPFDQRIDLDQVSVAEDLGSAVYFSDEFLGGRGKILAVDVPDGEMLRRGPEGYPYIQDRVPAKWITGVVDTDHLKGIKQPPSGAPTGGGAERIGGRLLQLPDTEQLTAELGRAPGLKDVFNVDRMGRRAVTAQANRLRAQAVVDIRSLGGTMKDAKGNILVRGIAPDAKDTARGQEWAPLVKVLEKPQNYDLTTGQLEAVQRLGAIPELVRVEREGFGIGPRIASVEEGDQFIWRKAKQTSKGVSTDSPRPSIGGTRLGGGGDKSRVIADIDDALDMGVVYSHPNEAFDSNVIRGLNKSVDEHVKSLLVPMSDSAANRVSPALRAKHDYLVQRLTSLKGTLGRLDARTRGVIDAYVNAAEPDMDALYDELRQVKVGLNAVGKAGPNFGKTGPDVARDLEQVMADIRTLRPAWRREVRLSKAVPTGRAGVPMDIAPALAGRDFDPRVAQRIEDYYRRTARVRVPGTDKSLSLRADIPVARAISGAITPVRATGDASAIMINQATTAARHPLTFGRNVAAGFRDIVADGPYNRWLASGETDDAARHGVAIAGEAGEQLEFQFNNWMQRVTVLKQLNNHYTRFNNRQRVDLFNLEVAARGGRDNVDAATKEGIARAINRFTGVSNARATDLEALTEFAPNFTRAHIETIASALSNGTIEGKLARQYLATMLAAGSSLVAGIAMAQGRDVSEVLKPFDLDELKNGKLRLNSNFMSYRAFGQDVKVFGKYDSLMRLVATAADSGLRAVGERDAMQLFDAIGYASGSMGSPVASFLTSLIRDETFSGDAPLSARGLISNVTPFTSEELVGGLKSAGTNALAGDFGAAGSDLAALGTTFAGGKALPLTPTEQLDQITQARFQKNFYDLEPYQRAEILKANPDLAAAKLDRSQEGTQEAAAIKTEYVAKQEGLDAKLLSGEMKREDWVSEYRRLQTERGVLLNRIYGDDPITKPENPGQKYAMYIQQSKDSVTGQLDFDKLDEKMAGLTASDREYLARNLGLDDTPVTRAFREMRAVRKVRNGLPKYRGFSADQAYEIDDVWQEVRNMARSADELDMRRALRQYRLSNAVDPAVLRAVQRRISGKLRQTNDRARFDRAHPEMSLFYGRGRLAPGEVAMVSGYQKKAA